MTTRTARFVLAISLSLSSLTLAAAGRPLAPRTIAPTTNFVFHPVSAFAGGRFLTIWRESMGLLGEPLLGAFSDAGGARLSERSLPLGIDHAFSYDVVGTGGRFTLFWIDESLRTFMADVDLEGNVTNRRVVDVPSSVDTRFAWNGTHFLAVIQTPGSLLAVATMFDSDGRAVLPPVAVQGTASLFDITVVDGTFVVTRTAFNAVFARTVTPQGFGSPRQVNDAIGATYQATRVASAPAGNGDLLVVWGADTDQQGGLRSAILRADGSRTTEVVVTGGAAGIGPLEVLRTGDGYLVAYVEGGGLHRVRLDASGARIGQPELVHQPFTSNFSSAAGDGTILIPFNTTAEAYLRVATIAITAENQPQPELVSLGLSRQMQPVLAEGADNLLATWTELAGDAMFVRTVPLSDEGDPGPPAHVADGGLAASETPWNQAGAFGEDSHHLVVARDDGRLLATRVADDGTVVDTTPVVIAEVEAAAEAAVVWVDSRWVVVWTDGSVLRSLTVSRAGVPSVTRLLDVHAPLPEGTLRFIRRPRLAYDGGDVLLAWMETYREPDDTPIGGEQPAKTWAVLLSKTGTASNTPPLDLELDGPSLSVASSGFDFAVVAGQHARILKGDGPLRVTASRELFPWRAVSDVTWDRNDYDVALRYYGATTDWYLAVRSLDGDGNLTGNGRATSTLPAESEVAPSIAEGGFGALIGVQEGSVADGTSATVYREQDFAFMPAPPSPPRNVHVRQLSSTQFEVSWDAPAGDEPGSYIVEQLFHDGWTVAARVEGTVRAANVVSNDGPPAVRVRAFNAAGPSEPAEHGGTGRPRRRSVR